MHGLWDYRIWNFVLPGHYSEFKYTLGSNKNLLPDDSSSVAGMKQVEVFYPAGNGQMPAIQNQCHSSGCSILLLTGSVGPSAVKDLIAESPF